MTDPLDNPNIRDASLRRGMAMVRRALEEANVENTTLHEEAIEAAEHIEQILLKLEALVMPLSEAAITYDAAEEAFKGYVSATYQDTGIADPIAHAPRLFRAAYRAFVKVASQGVTEP